MRSAAIHRPGWRAATQVLSCECEINTGKTMRMFRVERGQLTKCPAGHGPQKTAKVTST